MAQTTGIINGSDLKIMVAAEGGTELVIDNITDCCPSIQEALDLRNEVLKLRKEVIAQKEELILKDKQSKLECEKQVVLNSRLDLIRGGFANIGVLLNQGLN